MNYEEKIEYAEPLVIEKRLMQQLIDPGTDIRPLNAEAAEIFLAEYEVLRFENPLETQICKPFCGEKETECVTALAVKKETIKKIDALEHDLDEARQNQWRTEYLQDCKSGMEVKPLFGVDIEYDNISWENPLDEEEMDYLTQITPTSFVLDPKGEPGRIDQLDSALITKFGAFLNRKNGEIEDDKYYCAPEFRRNEVCYYGSLRFHLHEVGEPVKSFGNWNEQTKTWSGVFDLSQLNADDKEDIKDALEELPEKLSQEKVFQGAKEDELFWRESVTAPIEQTLRLLEEPKKEIKLQVKEKDLSMADVLERSIREKAEERWKAIETERNQSKAVLTPENRKVFDVLFEAYVATEELQKHPRLQKALEKQLLSVFVAAQKKGITVGLNEYSMDAPSRNQTIIQVKQPARDREKQLLSVFVAAQKKGITVGLNEYSMDAPSRNQTIIQVKQPARDREKQ